MNILFVSQRYHPFVGGLETQLRMVVHRLGERHHVDVAAICLRDNSGRDSESPDQGAFDISALDRLVRTRIPRGSRLVKLKRVLEDSLLAERYESYIDGSVPVHAIGPMVHQRVVLFFEGLRRFGHPVWNLKEHDRREYHGRFWHSFFRGIYVPRLRALTRGKDVVHCVADGALGWAAEEAARAEGVPFVINPYVHPGHHGDDADNVLLYQRADMVFALIETGRQTLIDLGVAPERIRLAGVVPLLPPSTDPAGFRARYGLGTKPMVLFLGRMADYKGFSALLDAAALVWRELPDVHFLFAGPGDAQARQRFARANDGRVHYLGLIDDQQKGDALAACDLFCMPSVAEILPAVYLEAWSYGKPVVGGTAHGLAELIEGNDGGVVVEQQPQAIAASLCALLRDESRRARMGQRGRELVAARFSESALLRIFESAYEDLRRSNPTASWMDSASRASAPA